MPIGFNELRKLKQLGLTYTSVMVKLYLDEHGYAPVGKVADACGCSIRAVELAFSKLKQLQLLPEKSKPKKHAHDHVSHGSNHERTAQPDAGSDEQDCAHQAEVDPIRRQLLDYEVLPWLVDQLCSKVERQELEKQLQFHAYRLAHGFKFRGHPARFLFSACLNAYASPEGFHMQRYKAQEVKEGRLEAPKVSTPYQPPQRAAETPVAPEETIREMLRSPVPGVRRLAGRLAVDWGVDISELATVAL